MGRKREINWGAIGAIAGIAGVVVALAATNSSHSNVADDPVEVTSKEPTPSPGQGSESARQPEAPRAIPQRSREPASPPTPGQPPRRQTATLASPNEPPPTQSQAPAQRVVNIGPVSTTNQQGGINVGYIENNNTPPR